MTVVGSAVSYTGSTGSAELYLPVPATLSVLVSSVSVSVMPVISPRYNLSVETFRGLKPINKSELTNFMRHSQT